MPRHYLHRDQCLNTNNSPHTMFARLENLSEHKSIVLGIVFLSLYYLPWYFDALQIVTIHDTLDGEVVLNQITGEYYKGVETSSRLTLNGAIPAYSYSRLLQPMTLLYAVDNPWVAYATTDILVRLVGLLGVYLLGRRHAVPPLYSVLVAILFTTSISYSVHLLSVAAIPLALWIFLEASASRGAKLVLLIICSFVVGLNTSLALSGIFVILITFPLLLCLKERISIKTLYTIGGFSFGTILGSLNLLYAQLLSGVVWHRSDWSTPEHAGGLSSFGYGKLVFDAIVGNPWYHASYSLWIASPAIYIYLILSKDTRERKVPTLSFLLILLLSIYIFSKSPLSHSLRNSFHLLNTLQWDRFYFLYSSIVAFSLLLILNSTKYAKKSFSLISTAIVLQIVFNLIQTPHIQALAKTSIGLDAGTTFNEYYLPNEYSKIKSIVNDEAVLSVGIDPMIAPMNGISSIDGYYSLYPLTYKRAFRDVIAESMKSAKKQDYFDKWGNRVYAFHQKGQADLIDFCAAMRLGANYVISREIIGSATLDYPTLINESKQLILYRINKHRCT